MRESRNASATMNGTATFIAQVKEGSPAAPNLWPAMNTTFFARGRRSSAARSRRSQARHSIPWLSSFCLRPFTEKRATPMTRLAGAARFAMRASVGPILPPTPSTMISPSARARSASSSGVGRVMNSSSAATSAKPLILAFARRAPGLVPVVAEEIGLAAVGLVEAVGHLEHREHQPALRPCPRLVAAAGGPPHQIAAPAFAPPAEEAALQ